MGVAREDYELGSGGSGGWQSRSEGVWLCEMLGSEPVVTPLFGTVKANGRFALSQKPHGSRFSVSALRCRAVDSGGTLSGERLATRTKTMVFGMGERG
jgi:hypothetical protein